MGWPQLAALGVWVAIALPALVVIGALVATLYGVAVTPALRRLPIDARETWPVVTMIVPACDEEESVEAALESALRQGYPELRLVVVDDRSRDGTGEILDRVARNEPRVQALHVTELPEGWLGKLNALARGVSASSGEWLLFADADAHFGPDTLKKAITYADANRVDFISVLPEIGSAGFFGDCVFNAAIAFFCLSARPWSIRDSKSGAIGATGAFMLVRRTAFDRTPGFEWLKLEVADDFGLCLMIKSFGGTCDLLNGREEVRLVWYASLHDMTVKMQKNYFAVMGRFSLARISVQAVVMAWLALFPFAVFVPSPHARWHLAVVAIATAAHVTNAVVASAWTGRPIAPALATPVGFLLVAFMMIRAAILGRRQGGITWRGVLYPTALLRSSQRVRV